RRERSHIRAAWPGSGRWGTVVAPTGARTIGGIRMRTALLVCGAVFCCCAVLAWHPGAVQAKGVRLDRTERRVVRLVNRIRARHGLRRLKVSARLTRAASNHTGDILRTGYLSHASSDGTPMATRVRRYTRARWIGEDIGFTSRRR